MEVGHRSVSGWAPKLVHQIRDLQLRQSLALGLHTLEVISRAEVELYSLWCAISLHLHSMFATVSKAPASRGRAFADISALAVSAVGTTYALLMQNLLSPVEVC